MSKKKNKIDDVVEIEDIFCVALGCMKMSSEDFCSCTPLEFKKIHDVWKKGEESNEKSSWERARMMMLCALQPYASKKLQPSDVMIFPWEENVKKNSLSDEEIKGRFKQACANFGIS